MNDRKRATAAFIDIDALLVGLFRHPDLVNDTWKQVLKREDLDPDKPRILEAGNNHLTLQPLKDD